MAGIAVRPFRSDDAEGLVALARDLAAALDDPPLALTPETLLEALAVPDPWCRLLVAERARTLVGYAATCRRFEPHLGKRSLWLADLHVAASERRRGIGRLLFAAVAREALEQGCERVVWDLWRANERGRAFYRALGAEADGDLEVWTLASGALLREGP